MDAGSTLILAGATPASVSNNGIIYDTAGLLDIDALTGSGTLAVQNGATLELAVATSESVVFSGSNATVILGTPLVYNGTLSGFGLGDSLVLDGIAANSATIVGGNTLLVMDGGTTVDTLTLSGNYSTASFAVAMSGTNAVVTNTGGAPARDDMPVSISVDDTAGLSTAQEDAIVNVLSAAAADWGQYVTGHTTLRIQLDITTGATGSELATGGRFHRHRPDDRRRDDRRTEQHLCPGHRQLRSKRQRGHHHHPAGEQYGTERTLYQPVAVRRSYRDGPGL